jgi:hypothetical protein
MSDKEKKADPIFNIASLNEQKTKDYQFVLKRIPQLQQARSNQYGSNLDQIWRDADRDYVPHRIKPKGTKAIVTDEDKGLRGAVVPLGSNDWQSDISQGNVFIKIQSALAILIDQNPTGVFTPTTKKYQATTELMRQLYQRSWDYAKSKQQLKLFVFNCSKYGWAIGRTYPLRIVRKVKVLKEFNQDKPDDSVYEDKEIVEYNDIMRENLDPRNAWIDDMTKPNNQFSMRDWCWRKVYAMDAAEEEFGGYDNWKYVKAGGNVGETVNASTTATASGGTNTPYQEENLVEILFYENRLKDLFMVIANGVPVIIAPLPIADSKGLKKLSCWQAYWNVRHSECAYGIGIYEAIRFDQAMLDRIRNMTIDQLTLSIYKMFFYQGTQSLTDTGDIKITPGVGKQTLDPKNISWLETPGPGTEAWQGIEMFKKDVDESSAISPSLEGEITGKTAFEIAQAKESALKRMKTPLDNILDALNLEGYITLSLIQILYSIPETYAISNPELIEDYLKEIESDPDLYERSEPDMDGNSTFTAKVFPEFPLNLEPDEKGNLIEASDTQFFRVKPKHLSWEGIINIKSQSLLSPSKQVDKALELEMYNLLIPLLGNPLGPLTYGKVAKNITKLYDKDPRDVLPEEWLLDPKELMMQQQMAQQQAIQDQPLVVDQDYSDPQAAPQAQTAKTAVPSTAVGQNPKSIVGNIGSRSVGHA